MFLFAEQHELYRQATLLTPSISTRSTMMNETYRTFNTSLFDDVMANWSESGPASLTGDVDCQQFNSYIQSVPISKPVVNFRLANHYIALVICIIGVIFNALLIAVLTQPKIRSPTNTIMTALAVADQIMMVTYGVYVVYFRIFYSPLLDKFESSWSLQWIYVTLYHYIYAYSHVLGEWLTLAIAIIRYRACYPRAPPHDFTQNQAMLVIAVTCIGCLIINIPNFLYFNVVENPGTRCFATTKSEVVKSIPAFDDFWFWFIFTTYRLLPNILLLVFTGLIIRELKNISVRRQVTLGNRNCRQEVWATKMLVAIVIFTMITEFPKLIAPLVYRAKEESKSDENFIEILEANLLEKSVNSFLECFILLDSCVNFVIYCSMSKMFRETFVNMFIPSWFPISSQSTRSLTVTATTATTPPLEMKLLAKTKV